jgi:hypothetical protein
MYNKISRTAVLRQLNRLIIGEHSVRKELFLLLLIVIASVVVTAVCFAVLAGCRWGGASESVARIAEVIVFVVAQGLIFAKISIVRRGLSQAASCEMERTDERDRLPRAWAYWRVRSE